MDDSYTSNTARQLFTCVMEGIDGPYMQCCHTQSEKVEIISDLIAMLEFEKSLILGD